MPEIKPGNLDWLDDLAALTAQVEKTPSAKRKELAKVLDLHPSMITFLKALKTCLDQAAIEKVRQAAQANPSYILSFNSAQALSGLNGKVADLLGSVHAALDVIFTHRLKPKQIEALVDWMASGKPASEFDPKAKPPETVEETTDTDPVELESEEEKTKRINTKKVKIKTLGQRIGNGIDKIVGFWGDNQDSTESGSQTDGNSEKNSPPRKFRKNKKGNRIVGHWFKKHGKKLAKKAAKFPLREVARAEHEICRKLAHVIVSSRRSSHSSSSRRSGRARSRGSFRQGFITLFQTVLHAVVYVLLQYGFWFMVATVFLFPFFPALKPLLEWPFRFAAHLVIFDLPSWVWACAHNYLVPTLVIGVVLAIGLVFAWQAEPLRMTLISAALVYLIIHGRGWSYQLSPFSQTTTSETQAVSTPPAAPEVVRRLELGSAKLKTSNSKLSTHHPPPAAAYQPAVSFIPSPSSTQTLYDPKILELEIAAIPKNSIVKDYPVTPDEGMPVDLAVSRMQDLTDADKYTMMIGGSKQIIQSVNAANSTLTIQFKSADPFDVLGGYKSPLNVFWEDLQYIHANEIDILLPNKPAQLIYQCSLVVKGAKYPLTIQCASSDDLEHLVSTMEFFIRSSRLGRDTALAGMPYPTQGVRLGGNCVVEKLWPKSPMDKAGVGLGDHFWSVGKNTSEQQSRRELEAGLQSLPATLFTVSPAEWDKAQITARQPGSDNAIHPQLRKVVLTAP